VSSQNANHRVPVQVFHGHEDRVICTSFYPDENKVVSCSDDGTLRIWDRKTGEEQVLSGHSRWVWGVDVSRDGKMVVSGGEDGPVRIWNGESGETMQVFEGHERWCHGSVFCARYSPNGNRIASAGENIQIWDAQTGNGILSIRNSSVFSLVWTADDTHVIGGGYRGITMWSSYTGEQLRTWKAYDTDHGVTTLSLSPSGAHLATANSDKKTAFVFDVSTGEQVAAFEHGKNIFGIAYSPSGKFIATGCNDMTVYVWEA
ncbi:hypothetical protein PAXINDRAFT_49128, partial [Paxillus involutus ATCC 200175]